ncbi:unnamed protein product [Prorocentrum cordatum]|uniref:Nuclear nucleic acid-binding protein C1D n=1 Tax=Prorocentrum cordatum TaxID=2364126 RepID=A0ABN9UAR7_9DINO|nr:unnamed protein product [Polarella glacialis]
MHARPSISSGMASFATETQRTVAACSAALVVVEQHLRTFLRRQAHAEVARKLSPLENAELQIGLTYAIASLYFCNLLAQGVDLREHPIRQEIDRIQLYFKKVQAGTEQLYERTAVTDRLRLDTDAARRIVRSYTSNVQPRRQGRRGTAPAEHRAGTEELHRNETSTGRLRLDVDVARRIVRSYTSNVQPRWQGRTITGPAINQHCRPALLTDDLARDIAAPARKRQRHLYIDLDTSESLPQPSAACGAPSEGGQSVVCVSSIPADATADDASVDAEVLASSSSGEPAPLGSDVECLDPEACVIS